MGPIREEKKKRREKKFGKEKVAPPKDLLRSNAFLYKLDEEQAWHELESIDSFDSLVSFFKICRVVDGTSRGSCDLYACCFARNLCLTRAAILECHRNEGLGKPNRDQYEALDKVICAAFDKAWPEAPS